MRRLGAGSTFVVPLITDLPTEFAPFTEQVIEYRGKVAWMVVRGLT